MVDKITMYKRSNNGSVRFWSIWAIGHVIHMEYGQVGGEVTENTEVVSFGLSSRTIKEQIELRINSRIESKKNSGYVNSIDEVGDKATNQLGLAKPMLASRFDKHKGCIPPESYLQYKYDGNRCMIANVGGEIIAYSRNGKEIKNIGHILKDIKIGEGDIVDGELYCHGESLQTIVSWIKRKQPCNKRIKFVMYDIVRDTDYVTRYQIINHIYISSGPAIQLAVTRQVSSVDSIQAELEHAISIGYEGLMLRLPDEKYLDGRRSKTLLKVKKFDDDEFEIIKISKTKDGWAKLHLQTKAGVEFRATAPGSVPEKIDTYRIRDKMIGKYVNVSFAGYTKDGVPFQPIANYYRDLEGIEGL